MDIGSAPGEQRQIRRVEPTRRGFAQSDLDRNARGAQKRGPLAGHLRKRIAHGGDDAPHAGPQHGISARRRLAVMAARFERDVERGTLSGSTGFGQRVDLGVRFAVLAMPAGADKFLVAHHDGADERIRLDGTAAALGQCEGLPHPGFVGRHGEGRRLRGAR